MTLIEQDKARLELNCTKEEIKSLTKEIVHKLNGRFSFSQLVKVFTLVADERGLFDKSPNTIYQGGFEPSKQNIETINLAVWEMIWDRQLVIALYEDSNISSNLGSTALINVKQNEQS